MTLLRQDRLLTEVHIGRCCAADPSNHSHLTEGATITFWREATYHSLTPPDSSISSLCCNPGVLKDFLCRVALEGVDDKAPADQLLSRVGHFIPVGWVELKKTREDLVKELLLVVGPAGEWGVATEEDVHDHTNRPDINLKYIILLVCIMYILFSWLVWEHLSWPRQDSILLVVSN